MPSGDLDPSTQAPISQLISVGQLGAPLIAGILRRSRELDQLPRVAAAESHAGHSVGLLFLTSSLRTRVGFATAGARLGFSVIDVAELRFASSMSQPESFEDTLRTVSGFVDLLVARVPVPVTAGLITRSCVSAFVNAGDGGDNPEHPTQALIDLRAIEDEAGPVSQQRVAICGDLTQRAPRSLLQLFNLIPPTELILIAPSGRSDHRVELSEALRDRTSVRDPGDFSEIDVVYLAGLPPGSGIGRLDAPERRPFSLDSASIRSLALSAVVLSPMPVIDEVHQEVRTDSRVRLFAPSDRSVSVRMAVMEHLCQNRDSLRGHST